MFFESRHPIVEGRWGKTFRRQSAGARTIPEIEGKIEEREGGRTDADAYDGTKRERSRLQEKSERR